MYVDNTQHFSYSFLFLPGSFSTKLLLVNLYLQNTTLKTMYFLVLSRSSSFALMEAIVFHLQKVD